MFFMEKNTNALLVEFQRMILVLLVFVFLVQSLCDDYNQDNEDDNRSDNAQQITPIEVVIVGDLLVFVFAVVVVGRERGLPIVRRWRAFYLY